MKQLRNRFISLIMLLLLLTTATVPTIAAEGNQDRRIIRVGYMNYPGFIEERRDGEMVGYCADYLDEICKYTDWDIEYVFASLSHQLDMLEKGELDIVPLAQYSDERAERFGFTHQPMGLLQCVLVDVDDGEETIVNSALACDGKTIGAQRGSRNVELLADYAELMDFSYTLVEYDYQNELEAALVSGKIDIIACEQMLGMPKLRILDHFASEPYYCMTKKDDCELLDTLDRVMSSINAHDPTYTSKLYRKHFGNGSINEMPYFTKQEAQFIASCGDVTVAIIPDSQPGSYCDADGNASGIIPDIMENVSELCGISFNYVFVPNDITPLGFLQENPEYIASGVLSTNPAFATADVLISEPYYTTWSGMAVRTDRATQIDIRMGKHTVAVPASFQAMHLFLNENYPNLTIVDCSTVDEGMQAVSDRKVDLFAYDTNMIMPRLGNPRFGDLSTIEPHLMLNPQCTVALNSPENELLIDIINKCIFAIPDETLARIENTHLHLNVYRYKSSDAFYRYRLNMMVLGTIILGAFAILITLLLFRQRRYTRESNRRAERDLMTGVYNRTAAIAAIKRYFAANTEGTPFAFLILDVDDLKGINDTLGHAAGDEAIQGLAVVLQVHFRGSDIISRIGGDEFVVFLGGIGSREKLTPILERLMKAIVTVPISGGERYLSVSIGAAFGAVGTEDDKEMYRRADEALYRAKREGRNCFAYYEDR